MLNFISRKTCPGGKATTTKQNALKGRAEQKARSTPLSWTFAALATRIHLYDNNAREETSNYEAASAEFRYLLYRNVAVYFFIRNACAFSAYVHFIRSGAFRKFTENFIVRVCVFGKG